MENEVSTLDYFERHPVRVVSALNALGLTLWSTVKYPGKEDVVETKRRLDGEAIASSEAEMGK